MVRLMETHHVLYCQRAKKDSLEGGEEVLTFVQYATVFSIKKMIFEPYLTCRKNMGPAVMLSRLPYIPKIEIK
jgi:hypothetical protein